MPEKITLDEANGISRAEFVSRFGSLYEYSPWVAEAAAGERPFGGLDEMHGAFESAVRNASGESRLALINAHPDLAGKAAMAGELTPESASEQSSAGLDRLSPDEYEEFTRLNREYREKFGIPMIVMVREHTKHSILESTRLRLDNSGEKEMDRALEEITKITRYRLGEMVEIRVEEGEER